MSASSRSPSKRVSAASAPFWSPSDTALLALLAYLRGVRDAGTVEIDGGRITLVESEHGTAVEITIDGTTHRMEVQTHGA